MESVPSPISVHNTESEGHTKSWDEDEAITMHMDDDDIDTIENKKPSDIVRVYDTVNKKKKLPWIPTQKLSGDSNGHCHNFSQFDEIFKIQKEVIRG